MPQLDHQSSLNVKEASWRIEQEELTEFGGACGDTVIVVKDSDSIFSEIHCDHISLARES
jgi:hypothetical protein